MAGCFALGLIFSKFLPSYFGEKGRNLATKEDIDGITRQIEDVKHGYAAQLEEIRANFSGQLATHGHRYQREFAILEDLARRLVDVRDLASAIRPVIDYYDPRKSANEIKVERINALWQAQRRLYRVSERSRPFYPKGIYDAVQELEETARREGVFAKYQSPENHPDGPIAYWDEAAAARTQLMAKADVALNTIALRVARWDAITSSDVAAEEVSNLEDTKEPTPR